MKTGRSLTEIAAELERRKETAKDYIAPQGKLKLVVQDQTRTIDEVYDASDAGTTKIVKLDGLNGDPLVIRPHFHAQMADHLQIPKAYYDRMLAEDPALLTKNVNAWLAKGSDDRRMIRTLDYEARAFLSPKYRPLDNYDLASAVLPVLQARGVQVMSAELTETRMYIKGILPDLTEPLPEGLAWGGHNSIVPLDAGRMVRREGHLVAAIVISNSEVGAGTLRIEPSVFTTWCTNLAILAAAAMKKYHVGRTFEEQSNFEVYRDDTRKADDRAFWLKARDVLQAAFDEKVWKAAIEQVRGAASKPILNPDLSKVVEVAVKRLALPEGTQGNILTHLARGGDLSAWGLSSAITAVGGERDDYEDATSFERAGGKVLTLGAGEWKAISEAA